MRNNWPQAKPQMTPSLQLKLQQASNTVHSAGEFHPLPQKTIRGGWPNVSRAKFLQLEEWSQGACEVRCLAWPRPDAGLAKKSQREAVGVVMGPLHLSKVWDPTTDPHALSQMDPERFSYAQ